MIIEKRRTRALYQRIRLLSHKQKYNKLANYLKKSLTKQKSKSLKSFFRNLSPNDDSLWRATKKHVQNQNTYFSNQKHHDSFAISDTNKSELFKNYLSDIFKPHSDIYSPDNINSVKEFLNPPQPVSYPIKHFTPNEVKYVVNKYPLNKIS